MRFKILISRKINNNKKRNVIEVPADLTEKNTTEAGMIGGVFVFILPM